MIHHGAGDRWLAGEKPAGVLFAQHDHVRIASGAYAGERGTVLLLVGLTPEPRFLVALTSGRGDVRVPQSALEPAHAA